MPLPSEPLPSEPLASPALPARLDRRVEARLAVYTQHAALVAEQATAVAAGDVARAAALDDARVRAAEHFAELQAVDAGDDLSGPSFQATLDTALAELAHQGAVDAALAQRFEALREAVRRGAEWAGAASERPRLALPAPAARVEPPVTAPLEGALVAARAAGVGGILGGVYPGRGPEWPAALAAGSAEASDVPRLDVRF